MINGLLTTHVIIATLSLAWLLQLLHWFVLCNLFCEPSDLNNLQKRMKAHADAAFKRCESAKIDSQSSETLLLPDTHQIMLGTLKKVEGKGATLTSILVFALAISLSSFVSTGDADRHVSLFAIFCLVLLFPTLAAIRIVQQIDQFDFIKHLNKPESQGVSILQKELAIDLIRKEKAFRFAKFWTALSVIVLVLKLSVDAIWEVHCKSSGYEKYPCSFKPSALQL